MKNKRLLIFVFTVLAILGIGVGYAALTDTLTISSTVGFLNTKEDDISDSDAMDVVWVRCVPYASPTNSQGERADADKVKHNATNSLIDDDEKDTITGLKIENMCVEGDKAMVTYTFKLLDNAQFSANVEVKLYIEGNEVSSEGTYNDLFSYSAKVGLGDPAVTPNSDTVILSPNEIGTFTLTVTMIKTLFSETLDVDFEVKLNAKSIG